MAEEDVTGPAETALNDAGHAAYRKRQREAMLSDAEDLIRAAGDLAFGRDHIWPDGLDRIVPQDRMMLAIQAIQASAEMR